MAVAVKPSSSLLNIRSGIKSVKDSFSGLRKNSGNLNNVLLKKTKVKKELLSRNSILSQRRQEDERRKNKEDLLEASTIGGVVKRQAKAVASSAKGFLGRIMDFLGTLLVGWLLTNLPSIITMAQELIARIQRLYTIVTGFFDNTIKLFRGFGNLLGAVGKNILTFDFTDSKGRVESSLKDLGGTFEDMQSQFDEGFKLLTTSLGEGVVSGEDAQPFGTQYENESMREQPSGSSGGGKWKPLLDIISSVESSTDKKNNGYDAQNGAPRGVRPGLSQMTIGEIARNAPGASGRYQQMPQFLLGRAKAAGFNENTVFSPQVQDVLAIKQIEGRGGNAWLAGRIPTETFMQGLSQEWAALPNAYGNFYYKDQSSSLKPEKIKAVLEQVKSSPTQTTPRTPAPIQSSQAVSTSVVDQFKGKPGGAAGIITSERGMRLRPTSGKYRMHHGIDIAPAGRGYFVALKLSGKVNLVAFDSGGYGNYVDIKSGNTIYRFAHLAKVYVKQGQTYNGATIGEIGSTGGSTGIHLHFEVRPGGGNSINPRPYLGLLSIGKQLTGLAGQPAQVATPRPTPAQITSSGTQQRQQASQQLAQQQVGPSIIIIEEEPPPQSQGSIGGGGAMMIPIIINPLNSFITKKLLLDLAYT
jgi:murein DD-endopeptidase MepM/ murein hydrolase activator NlpD